MERDCPECDGWGFTEWRLTETRFKQIKCVHCSGQGRIEGEEEEDDDRDEE
jgi:DnaJ-class molecular chaperone